ncbi:MAG: MFS transporter [Polyangiaceae bacterium]|nr:MFS transporter [Polyangiaceae bacterium]
MTQAPTPPQPAPFPRVFKVAIAIEVLERLAFYGVYINLQVYLVETVGLTVASVGSMLAVFAIFRSWLPVVVGGFADRLGFRASLLIAFSCYTLAYGLLFAGPTLGLAYVAILGMGIGGAFMKPVITGAVRRYSPEGRQTQGFAIFYASVNAGSVIGKSTVYVLRRLLSLRTSLLVGVVGSVLALVTAALLFFEPADDDARDARPREPLFAVVTGYAVALRNVKLTAFLVAVSGYYLLIEQFYQTFPLYFARLAPTLPRELVSLVNPLTIALLQVGVARASKRLDPLLAMTLGVLVGSVSMLAMGVAPGLGGAVASFFLFGVAEMIFSPRFYDFVGAFAPKGKEGLYMGLALAPAGLGGFVGGKLSGALIERFMPKGGAIDALSIWGTYAVIGVGCALVLFGYRATLGRGAQAPG